MCGIFGEFFTKGRLTAEAEFRELNNFNLHRGPDAEGYWRDAEGPCQLGFRRLSILDLSENGNQPMVSDSGEWAMIFNGEIYNFADIRKMLPPGKYKFRGHSDSEVILCAFDHFGVEKTAALLDGMFAIALYHVPAKKLYLIRDFAGIKPLFYAEVNGNVVFGSQYDQISSHPIIKGSPIDAQVLQLYLQQHYMPAPFGILQNTKQLEPGQIISFDSNGKKESSFFWSFPPAEKNFISSEQEALQLIDAQLESAVVSEMISDVPLGSFLSGGIDSPLITYYAHKHNRQLKSFSIGSDSSIHDESADARRFAEMIGTRFYLDMMNAGSAVDIIDSVMKGLKEPFADSSAIPTFLVSRHARKQVTVALSGDGGDELFFGYERFWSVLKNAPYKFIPQGLRYLAYGADRALFKNRHINSAFLHPGFGAAHQAMHSRFSRSEISSVFPDLRNSQIPENFSVYHYKDTNDRDLLYNMQKAEFYGMMQKTLIKVDRMSMANSLEVRVPFLKKSFIEQSLKIDAYLSYGKGKKKELLKKLLRKNVGEFNTTETKRGFSIPLSDWLRKDLKEPVRQAIFDNSFTSAFNIDTKALDKIWNDHMNNTHDGKWQLFTVYSLAKWHQSLK